MTCSNNANLTCNRYAALLKIVPLSFVVLLFSACGAAPTREDTSAFKLLREGSVQPKSTQAFADCLLDGFDKAHYMLSNNTSRQQRRSDSYRVESLAGGRILLVSADIFDDGRVLLHESTSAALINTTGERESFQKCLSQYGI
jgi:hypothetical protein